MSQAGWSYHRSTRRAIAPLGRCIWGSAIVLLLMAGQSAYAQTSDLPAARSILRIGSQGSQVSELQAMLKLLGFYTGSVDGQFQDDTATAVSSFQQAAGIAADGIAGSDTWDRLLPAVSAPAPVTPAPAPTSVDLPILRTGTQGSAVARLQERLRAAGFFQGAIDGVFGAETEAAVKAAQSRYQLEPDGVVGAATWAALLR